MAGNSEKQMKVWIANRQAQIKRQFIKEENARLKCENEMLMAENRKMIQMQRRRSLCGNCLKIENARLRAEYERLCAIAAKLKTETHPKGELRFPSTAFQTSADSNATGSQPEPSASMRQDEPPSM